MHAMKYKITTLAPVLVNKNSIDPNMVVTCDYMRGNMLIGVLAGILRSLQKCIDDHFYRWFVAGDIRITNAYITDLQEKINYPLPLSVQREKCTNKVYDLLFEDAPKNEQTMSIGGYGRLEENDGQMSVYSQSVKKDLNFHHERDSETGSSKEGLIFNYQSLQAKQVFCGYIVGSPTHLQELKDILGVKKTIRLGRSSNTQYGKARLELESAGKLEPSESLPPGKISLSFLSDAIIYNEYGYACADLNTLEKYLHKELGADVRIEQAFLRRNTVRGYMSVWKLPRPEEACIAQGSCLLLKIDNQAALTKIADWQQTGIGERVHEGYGHIALNWQQEMDMLCGTLPSKKHEKPQGKIPESVKTIMASIVGNNILQRVEAKAIRDAKDIKNIPSRSAIGRMESIFLQPGGASTATLQKLRKTVCDQLKKSRKGEQTLWDFLLSEHNFDKIWLSDGRLASMAKEIEYGSQADREKMRRRYFQTFFSTLRKLSKNNQE